MNNPNNLPEIWNSKELVSYSETTSISVYKDILLTDEIFNAGVKLMKSAYPNMKDFEGFCIVLKGRCKEHKFTNLRFREAVKNMIDTCDFASVPKVIQFDKQVKLIPIKEFNEKYASIENSQYYMLVDDGGEPKYALISDVKKYNLPVFISPTTETKQLKAPEQTDADREALQKIFADALKAIDERSK